MARGRKQDMNFRQEEVGRIMERWRAGDSCSLVGVGSVGKSNLLQHLENRDVQEFYIRDVSDSRPFRAIIIDPALLGPLPSTNAENNEAMRCWAGYELLMHRLLMAFHPFSSFPPEATKAFYDAYDTIQNGSNPLHAYLALRYFEFGLGSILRQGYQIVLMFDEFEELLRQMPLKFFLTLRGLRDEYKPSLSYLIFTRLPIEDVINEQQIDPLAIEPFAELFNDNVVYVGPYSDEDARRMISNLAQRNNRGPQPFAENFVIWASGRFAGLMRATYRVLDLQNDLDANTAMQQGDALLSDLARRPTIRTECITIWKSLNHEERRVLQAIARNPSSLNTREYRVQQVYALLEAKQIVRTEQGRIQINPPLLETLLRLEPGAFS